MWGALRRLAPSISSPQAYRTRESIQNITKRICLNAGIALLRNLNLQTYVHYVSWPSHNCLGLARLRRFSRGAGSHDLKIATVNGTSKEGTKKKKRTRKKKSSNKIHPSKAAEAHYVELTFPFEGTLDKHELTHTPETLAALQNSEKSGNTFTVHIGNTIDGSNTRVYYIYKNDETFTLPSVTTILSQTLPRQRGFMLSNWRKGLVKEVGEDGYQQARNQILAVGNRFHEVRREEGEIHMSISYLSCTHSHTHTFLGITVSTSQISCTLHQTPKSPPPFPHSHITASHFSLHSHPHTPLNSSQSP